jgi:chromosome condensin MukBEF complex kleisin-like MukF subunit
LQALSVIIGKKYIAEREIKGLGYEVFLIQIKQQVGEKIALCTHGNADCLWKKKSIKHSKYVFSQKFCYIDVVLS